MTVGDGLGIANLSAKVGGGREEGSESGAHALNLPKNQSGLLECAPAASADFKSKFKFAQFCSSSFLFFIFLITNQNRKIIIIIIRLFKIKKKI